MKVRILDEFHFGDIKAVVAEQTNDIFGSECTVGLQTYDREEEAWRPVYLMRPEDLGHAQTALESAEHYLNHDPDIHLKRICSDVLDELWAPARAEWEQAGRPNDDHPFLALRKLSHAVSGLN